MSSTLKVRVCKHIWCVDKQLSRGRTLLRCQQCGWTFVRTASMQWQLRHEYRPHFATFRGRHNLVKVRVFVLLALTVGEQHRGLSLSQITALSHENYRSLAVLLPRWVRWRYIGRCLYKGETIYSYYLLRRGERFIRLIVPPSLLKVELQRCQLNIDNYLSTS